MKRPLFEILNRLCSGIALGEASGKFEQLCRVRAVLLGG